MAKQSKLKSINWTSSRNIDSRFNAFHIESIMNSTLRAAPTLTVVDDALRNEFLLEWQKETSSKGFAVRNMFRIARNYKIYKSKK